MDAYGPKVNTMSRPNTRCCATAWFIAIIQDMSVPRPGIQGFRGINTAKTVRHNPRTRTRRKTLAAIRAALASVGWWRGDSPTPWHTALRRQVAGGVSNVFIRRALRSRPLDQARVRSLCRGWKAKKYHLR